ncbi:hypothetical protein SCE1572_16390 [Sorangium cellulosum So0157-2]|uniref:Uncharacterized protein n=1 Tax=Sorangium cellulosum So0157-2 TaxID=1254432 RepID=S4XVM5_SORCE|nr:hypothetical protein [Sorangium cellulosum]AGP35940.1 hypothetical protein SCE1572_16390 [Sorangium cellulosum So0157-2]
MGPAQLCTQRVHNVRVGENLGEAQHVVEVALAEAAAVLGREGSGHVGDDLLAVRRPALADDVLAKAAADLPVEPDELVC